MRCACRPKSCAARWISVVSPHWGPWATIAWGLAVGAAFFALQIGTVVALARLPARGAGEEEVARFFETASTDGTLFSIATFVTTVVCCPLIAGIVKLKKGSQLADYLALQPVDRRTALRWLGALAVLLLLSDLLTLALGKPIVPDVMKTLYETAQPLWLFWAALVVAAPIFEEVFFRGFLFKGLQASWLGTVGTVVVTAAIWAVIHLQYDAYGIATVFVMGLVLGAARSSSGSLLLPIGMHSAANFVASIETALAR